MAGQMRVYKGYNEMIGPPYSLTSKAEWKAFDRARLTYKNILWDPTSTDWPGKLLLQSPRLIHYCKPDQTRLVEIHSPSQYVNSPTICSSERPLRSFSATWSKLSWQDDPTFTQNHVGPSLNPLPVKALIQVSSLYSRCNEGISFYRISLTYSLFVSDHLSFRQYIFQDLRTFISFFPTFPVNSYIAFFLLLWHPCTIHHPMMAPVLISLPLPICSFESPEKICLLWKECKTGKPSSPPRFGLFPKWQKYQNVCWSFRRGFSIF